jgi:cytochrome c553
MQKPWVSALTIMLGFATFAHAEADISAGKAKAQQVCQACHGADGNGISPLYPKLAAQNAEYLSKQLADFKSGARKDPIMSPMAAGLTPSDIQNLAAYYASLPIKPGVAVGDKNTIELGKKIYRGGNAKTGVSACMSCHGPSGHGIPPRFPRVSGQHAAYTQKQLLMFKNGSRSNDNDVMTRIAFRMSEGEIKAVSEYMAGLK